MVAAAAATLGGMAGYVVGSTGGYRLLRRYGHRVGLNVARFKVARYLFDRHGGSIIFLGRFVAVLRTYSAFLAGTARMRYWRFFTFNLGGSVLWAAVFTAAAFLAGNVLSKVSTPVEVGLAVAAAIGVVVVILLARHRMDALTEKAERAYPGPLRQ